MQIRLQGIVFLFFYGEGKEISYVHRILRSGKYLKAFEVAWVVDVVVDLRAFEAFGSFGSFGPLGS